MISRLHVRSLFIVNEQMEASNDFCLKSVWACNWVVNIYIKGVSQAADGDDMRWFFLAGLN